MRMGSGKLSDRGGVSVSFRIPWELRARVWDEVGYPRILCIDLVVEYKGTILCSGSSKQPNLLVQQGEIMTM